MKKIVNYRALPIFLLFVIVGILVTTFLEPWAIIPLAILSGLALFATLFIAKIRKYLLKVIMIICALVLSLVSANIDVYLQRDYNIINEEVAVITGKVDGLSQFDENGIVRQGNDLIISNVTYTADNGNHGKITTKLLVFGNVEQDLKVGDNVTITGKLFTMDFKPTSQEYLRSYRNGIRNVLQLTGIQNVESGKPNFFDGIKISTKSNLAKFSSSSKIGNFIYSMLYGDKTGLDSQVKESFAISGLSHLFAVSGLHVGMIALVLMAILNKAKVNKWLQLLIMTIMLGVFNVLCGFSPSVLRATVMIIIAQVSVALGFRNDSISTLSFAGVFLLILRPMYLFDVSFLMTFFAVLGIVLLSKPINNKLSFMPSYLSKPLSLSISVNIGIFPIVIYYFGSVSLLFMVANLLIIPIVTLAYPLIFIANMLTLIMPFMGFLITPISYLFELIAIFGQAISKIPFFSVSIYMTVIFIVVWLALLIFFSDYIIVGDKLKKITANIMVLLFSFMAVFSAVGVANEETSISTAYSDYYTDDAYYFLRHNGEDILIVNGELTHGAVASINYRMRNKGIVDVEILAKSNMTEDDLHFINANMKSLGLDMLVMHTVNESFRNISELDLSTDYTNENIYLYCPSQYDIAVNVNKVNAIFSKNSQFEHSDIVYDIVYSNGNVLQAINYAPKYIVTNNQQGILDTPDTLINNDFTFKLKNGKIKLRSDNRWK